MSSDSIEPRDRAGPGDADEALAGSEPRARKAPSRAKARRGYAGRSAEQLSEERRDRLLAAAMTLFCERGYAKTPIETICSQARVTTRHFYEQFEGREALLRTLYERIVDSARVALYNALRDARLSPAERMQLAITAFVGHYTSDPRRARIACVEVMGVSAELSRLRRGNLRTSADALTAFTRVLVEQGDLPKGDYSWACIGLVGAITELLADWVLDDPRPAPESLVRRIARLSEAMITGARVMSERAESVTQASESALRGA